MNDIETEHGGAIYSGGRHGCWAACLCGWKSRIYATNGAASIAYAKHIAGEEA